MTRKELLSSVGYWTANVQISLYEMIGKYLKEKELSKTQFAEKLGVSKGYVSQVLNGDFNHKISKLVQLSLAVNKVPVLTFVELDTYVREDEILSSKSNFDNMDYFSNEKLFNFIKPELLEPVYTKKISNTTGILKSLYVPLNKAK